VFRVGLTSRPHIGIKTKIVATVGPATETAERLAQLVDAGVDVFRINMAHGRSDWRDAVVGRIRQVSTDLDRPLAILADLGGPKIRLGPVPGGSVECEVGQAVRFVADPAAAQASHDLTLTHGGVVHQLAVGDMVLLGDGMVSMQVEEKFEAVAVCRVVQPGEIRSGTGVNVPGIRLPGGALTEKDRGDVRWAAGHSVDFLGLSFVRFAADVQELRDALQRLGARTQIVAKIEKAEALERLDEIIDASDAIMVARGDLGVEIDVARIAGVQKQIIRRCQRARRPVITATHMLESMRSSRLPTRAEATDVANAILDGSDALMLSAETAIGQHPVEAVAMMRSIARETEPLLPPSPEPGPGGRTPPAAAPVGEALAEAASRLADEIRAALVLVATRDGHTARMLSSRRSRTPILGFSDREDTVRRMCLYWGVTPRHLPECHDSGDLLRWVADWGRRRDLLHPGDRVVVVASTHWSATGHNMIVVEDMT
jgi:pyruvate kinase